MKGKSKFSTLSYFDIFEYPVTGEELWQFLPEKISKEKFYNSLIAYSKKDGYYFLKGRQRLVTERIKREKISNAKLQKAVNTVKILKIIPTIRFIGISGGLSMKNSKAEDDIDLFVICKNNSVWTTRFIMIILLLVLGQYRRRDQLEVKDKICLNFFMGERADFKKKNLYIAHEISQMIPVYEKEEAYRDFILRNDWIFKFLPNVNERIRKYNIRFKSRESNIQKIVIYLLSILQSEKILKFFQFTYMKDKITKEEIRKDYLAFHPVNYEEEILESVKIE